MELAGRRRLNSGPPIIIPLERHNSSPIRDPRFSVPFYGLTNLEYRRQGLLHISRADWEVDLSQATSFDVSPASVDSGICIDYPTLSDETWIDKASDPRLHRARMPPVLKLRVNRTPGSNLKKKSDSRLFLNTTLPNICPIPVEKNSSKSVVKKASSPAVDIKKCLPTTKSEAKPIDKIGTHDIVSLSHPRTACKVNRTSVKQLGKNSEPKLFLDVMLAIDNQISAKKEEIKSHSLTTSKIVQSDSEIERKTFEEVINNVRRNQAANERTSIKRRETPPAPLVKIRPQPISRIRSPHRRLNRAPGSQLKKKPENKPSLNYTLPNIRLDRGQRESTKRRDRSTNPVLKKRCTSPAMKTRSQLVETEVKRGEKESGRLKNTKEWVNDLEVRDNCPLRRTIPRRFQSFSSQIPVYSAHVNMFNSIYFGGYSHQSNPTIQLYQGDPGAFQQTPLVYSYFPPIYNGMTPFPQHTSLRH